MHKPDGDLYDYDIKIPEYWIKCPMCGCEICIGVDERDYDARRRCAYNPYPYNEIIMNREDWVGRYKTDVKRKECDGSNSSD